MFKFIADTIYSSTGVFNNRLNHLNNLFMFSVGKIQYFISISRLFYSFKEAIKMIVVMFIFMTALYFSGE